MLTFVYFLPDPKNIISDINSDDKINLNLSPKFGQGIPNQQVYKSTENITQVTYENKQRKEVFLHKPNLNQPD